jgi:hypothetical protein
MSHSKWNKSESWWIVPKHNILVPISVSEVNIYKSYYYQNGNTNLVETSDSSVEYFKKTNCVNIDGLWYYVGDQFWIRYYGVLVPNNIKTIHADDKINEAYKEGGQTKMCANKEYDSDEYKNLFCIQEDDGLWYYVGDNK